MLIVSYLIDEIYSKERKYVKNVDKDNFLNAKSPIFQLDTFRHLKSNTGVEKRGYSSHVTQPDAEHRDVDLSLQCTAGTGKQPTRPGVETLPVSIPLAAGSAATFASAKTQEGAAAALINQITKADSVPSPLGAGNSTGNGEMLVDPGSMAGAAEQEGILMGMRNESALAPTNFAEKVNRSGTGTELGENTHPGH